MNSTKVNLMLYSKSYGNCNEIVIKPNDKILSDQCQIFGDYFFIACKIN